MAQWLNSCNSLVGFTSYTWLLRVTTPSRASTYAYVNPLVAVFLGWFLANEPVTLRTLIAAGVIVSAVVIITTARIHTNKLPPAERVVLGSPQDGNNNSKKLKARSLKVGPGRRTGPAVMLAQGHRHS